MTATLDHALPTRPVAAAATGGPVTDAATRTGHIDRHRPFPVRDARDFAVATVYDWHLPTDVARTVSLVVDELVANALDHADWPDDRHTVDLLLELVGHRLIVEVRDPGNDARPWNGEIGRADAVAADGTRGRGWTIAAALCDSADPILEPAGLCVRVSLALPDPRATGGVR